MARFALGYEMLHHYKMKCVMMDESFEGEWEGNRIAILNGIYSHLGSQHPHPQPFSSPIRLPVGVVERGNGDGRSVVIGL